jgi:hypothetical protein
LEFNIDGHVLKLAILPKQDIFHQGQNLEGKPGVALWDTYEGKTYTIAKIEWDHIAQKFVLYTGKGVN